MASTATTSQWGRVDDDGTVHLITPDGERVVGQYAAGSPDEALAFYTQRYDALAGDVDLLEKRVTGGKLSPEEAASSVKTMRQQVSEAAVVGDVPALVGRLDALGPVIALQRENRKAEKAQALAETQASKEKVIAAAEKVADGSDWRGGQGRLRELLEEWKALPRLDRAADDALWKRFSSARSSFSKRRKAHLAEQDEKRGAAGVVKQRLVREAEALSSSTDWGPTSGKYRDLMRDWKAAGAAPRDVEDDLWKRFRGAQDTFFGARDAANAQQDQEFAANAEVKEKLLEEAERLLPVKDLEAAKRSLRDIGEKWEAAGKVPRARIKELEGRLRKVEQTVRGAEDAKWRSSDPEKSARANDMVGQLESAIAGLERDLEQARAAGDEKRAKRVESDLTSRRSMLDVVQRASSDFGG